MANPAAAAVPCLATSPPQPSPDVLLKINRTSDRREGLVLHTGYNSETGDGEAAPSYRVVSQQAFEALLAEALANEPAEASAATADAPVVAGQQHNHLTRELQRLVRDVDVALSPLLAVKQPIDHYAYKRYYPMLKCVCLGVLAAQFAVYFNWIFYVFDWNLVEPTTYFIGYTGVFCSLVYHYYRCDATPSEDFTWRNLFVYLAGKKARTLYEKKGLDIAKLNNLEATKRLALAQLARYKP